MGHRGYTLLEILVVITLVAVLSGFAMLALRGNSEADRLAEAADRFAALVRLQCEEALFGNRSMRVRVDNRGYRFEVSSRGAWQAHGDDVFRQRSWPVALAARLVIDGLDAGEANGIYCLPTGEITPFELELRSRNGAGEHVRGTPDGRIERTGDRA